MPRERACGISKEEDRMNGIKLPRHQSSQSLWKGKDSEVFITGQKYLSLEGHEATLELDALSRLLQQRSFKGSKTVLNTDLIFKY